MVFTNTALPLHLGTLGGFGKHSSVRVKLLHVHRLQLECHTSPGWNTGIEIIKELKSEILIYFFNEKKILTSLGSPSGPLQSDGQENKPYIDTVHDNMHL